MQCYYESLGVDQTADAAALKKAYRAKALELHPDKNYHRVEEATKLFAIVQHAYQVLSDPHERAWYDSHRDSILRGQDPDPSSSTATPSSSNATPTSKLYPFFSPSAYSGFDDKDPKSFYRVYGDLFEKLQNEELTAAETDPESIFQSDKTSVFEFEEFVFFGNGDEEYPRDFYQRFLTFSSTKSFRWNDKFRLSDGGDRAVRRAMETQNQKFRSNARRDFNETVRELTRYIQKRDPRYQAYLDTQKRDRELKVGKAKEKVKAEKEKMREKIETFEVAEWAKGPEVEVDEEEVLEVLEELYCAACNKVFKSDRQWKNHEQSKKHQQNVEELRRQLLEEDELFTGGDSGDALTGEDADELTEGEDIDETPTPVVNNAGGLDAILAELDLEEPNASIPPEPPSNKRNKKSKKRGNWAGVYSGLEDGIGSVEQEDEVVEVVEPPVTKAPATKPQTKEVESDDEPKSKGKKGKKPKKGGAKFGFLDAEDEPEPSAATTIEDDDGEQKLSAKEKKRLREAKKQEKANAEKLACSVCGEAFATRNLLFDHLDETGHAVTKGNLGKNKKR